MAASGCQRSHKQSTRLNRLEPRRGSAVDHELLLPHLCSGAACHFEKYADSAYVSAAAKKSSVCQEDGVIPRTRNSEFVIDFGVEDRRFAFSTGLGPVISGSSDIFPEALGALLLAEVSSSLCDLGDLTND